MIFSDSGTHHLVPEELTMLHRTFTSSIRRLG
jgi:hypothetical protein